MIGAATSCRGRPASTETSGQLTVVERLPQRGSLLFADRRVDRRNPSVRGDDEGGADLEARRGIAERRLHRRLVASGDCGPEAEVAREQLGGVLKLVRTLLPEAVINRAA